MPVTATTRFQFFWHAPSVSRAMRAGVSLHSHTMYSEEGFEIIPEWVVSMARLKKQVESLIFGKKPDAPYEFRRGYWTPPLTPRQAYRLEQKQIENLFQLPGFVSLTDHDDIRAGGLLSVLDQFRNTPISTEWTVPYGPTFFHLGVHNLKPSMAETLRQQMAAYTAEPKPEQLQPLFEQITKDPDVLVVLNHPLWDEKHIGQVHHAKTLRALLDDHGRCVHALELNGLRTLEENKLVRELADSRNLAAVAGGDRHGLEPNAVINLTAASTLVEFLHEVRYRRFSHVVFLPQYSHGHVKRIVRSVVDVLQDYPENFAGRRTWGDRVFYRDPEGGPPIPFASVWEPGALDGVRRLVLATRLVDRRRSSAILTSA